MIISDLLAQIDIAMDSVWLWKKVWPMAFQRKPKDASPWSSIRMAI